MKNSLLPLGSLLATLFLSSATAIETTGITSGEFRVSEQGAATYSIPFQSVCLQELPG